MPDQSRLPNAARAVTTGPLHWCEGMVLRPHHLQYEGRRFEGLVEQHFRLARPFAWGVADFRYAADALESYVLRVEEALLRLKDGTWIRIPENTSAEPLHLRAGLEAREGPLEIYFGIPQYSPTGANSISVTEPQQQDGNPRFEPIPLLLRDENTGSNEQRVLIRRLRGRLFYEGQQTAGYELIRLGALRRTSGPGAVPAFDPELVGPQLAVQANAALAHLLVSLADEVEAHGDELAEQARETQMSLADGVAANIQHLMRLQIVNGIRTRLRAIQAAAVLHPYDLYVELASVAGELSIFDRSLYRPEPIPEYDHDYPGRALLALRRRIGQLLTPAEAQCSIVPFTRVTNEDGREALAVELKLSWVEEQCPMYIALESADFSSSEKLLDHIYSTYQMTLGSPSRTPKLYVQAVRGLRLEPREVRPGTLPKLTGLHYYWIDKSTQSGYREDHWKECEKERGIWLITREGQRAAMENFKPTLYVLKGS